MAIPRVYWPEPVESGDTLTLNTKQAHHLLTVLRVESGGSVIVFGHGRSHHATLAAHSKKNVELVLGSEIEAQTESTLNTELAVCVYRGKQWDYGIQKAVELGVTTIQPIISHKTDVPLNTTAATKRAKHTEKIIIAACEQSGRNKLPILKEEQILSDYLSENKKHRIVCDFYKSTINWEMAPLKDQTVSILIGPAGGFTQAESDSITNNSVNNLNLGPRILRSDTACIAALTLIQAHWGDLHC